MKLSDHDIQNLREYAKLTGEDYRELLETIVISGDTELLEDIRETIMVEAASQIVDPDPFFPYPEQEVFSGNLEIGQTKGVIVRLSVDEMCKNFLCSGIVGSGKTTNAFDLMMKLNELGIKWFSIGVKQDVRHLAGRHDSILILRCSPDANFSLGDIFKAPQGVNEKDFQTEIIRCFAVTTFIGESGRAILDEVITNLRAKYGYVDLAAIIRHIKTMKIKSKRMADSLSTVVNRLVQFHNRFGIMMSANEPFPIEHVIENYNVELEVDGAGEFRFFFPALFLLRIFKHRIANNIRGNKLHSALFCDEVNLLASRHIENHATLLGCLPTLLEYMPLCREFKIGFILYSNQPSEVSDVVKAQAGIKMTLRLGSWTDIRDMGNSMTLTKEQMDAIVDLPTGNAVMKIQGIKPFPIVLPGFEIKKTMTDEEVDENNRRLLQDSQWENFINIDESSATSGIDKSVELNDIERSILLDGYVRKYVPLTQRYKDIGVSMGTGSRLVKTLENRGLIRIHAITLGGRGSNTKFMELTQDAYEAIQMKPKVGAGRGADFAHGFWQYYVQEKTIFIKVVRKATVEGRINNKYVDILIETMSKKFAVEVAMTSGHEKVNIEKDLEAGCVIVFVGCKDKSVLSEVEKMSESLPVGARKRVVICLIQKVIDNIKEYLSTQGG